MPSLSFTPDDWDTPQVILHQQSSLLRLMLQASGLHIDRQAAMQTRFAECRAVPTPQH